jgi:broad specificity phosphatase PhoE
MKEEYTYFESRFDARKRALKAIDYFKSELKKLNPGEKIAVVAHFAILRQITGTKFSPTDGTSIDGKKFENCEVYEYQI